jgi:hypothetical protein
MFADVALSEKPPYLESALVMCFLVSPGGRWRRLGKDGFSATRYRLVSQDLVSRSLGGSWRS